jgi:neopullulanase
MPQTFQTPEWVHHAVLPIFPDRFAPPAVIAVTRTDTPPTPYGFKGGDLIGVVEKLDYLQDLGINAIYFTPIFSSASNHRYHTHDYLQIDPLLGGRQAFDSLLKEAHRRGIRIVLDGVFNHASRGFFQFNHILEVGPQSPYLDWFKVRVFPCTPMRASRIMSAGGVWQGCRLSTTPTPGQAYIYDVARYWLDQALMAGAWTSLRVKGRFLARDSARWSNQPIRCLYTGKSLGCHSMAAGRPIRWRDELPDDLSLLELLSAEIESIWTWSGIGAGMTENSFVKDATSFPVVTNLLQIPCPAVLAQMNLLDSHDTARFLSITGTKDALRLATLFQMTYPGAPCVYYGNEIGMEGKKDPDCRRTFNWNESTWDHELRAYFQKCIRLRMEHPALRDGEWKLLHAAGGIVVYLRSLGDDTVVVVLNNSNETYHLDVQPGLDYSGPNSFVDIFTPGSANVENGRLSGLTVPPFSGAALVKG